MISEHIKIKKLFIKLQKQKTIYFPKKGKKISASKERGVYIIRNKQGSVLHVGSTPRAKNGIWQRLRDHLAGQSSFVYYYLNKKQDKLRNGYKYQYLEVEDPRLRALLEAYAIAHLCPKHLGVGD